jgi:predicted AAA+ superfamily ATPase
MSQTLYQNSEAIFYRYRPSAYLAGWTTPESLETGISSGSFFETFVVSEILKSYYHNGITPNFYYYRDNNKNEIDLIIHQDGRFYPIEIKRMATPKEIDVKNFKALSTDPL